MTPDDIPVRFNWRKLGHPPYAGSWPCSPPGPTCVGHADVGTNILALLWDLSARLGIAAYHVGKTMEHFLEGNDAEAASNAWKQRFELEQVEKIADWSTDILCSWKSP